MEKKTEQDFELHNESETMDPNMGNDPFDIDLPTTQGRLVLTITISSSVIALL